MKHRKTLIMLALVAVAGLAAFWFYGTQKETEVDLVPSYKPLIKVGLIYPTEGQYKALGDAVQVALELFEQDAKTRKSPYSYEIMVEDSHMDPTKSISIANKLKKLENIDVYITFGSKVSNVISLIAEKNQVIHFAISDDEKAAKGEYNFVMTTPPNQLATKLLHELQKKNMLRAALLTQNQSQMLTYGKAIRDLHGQYQVELTDDKIINTGERDFRMLITKTLANKPDIIIAQLTVPELTIFIKQFNEMRSNLHLANIKSMNSIEDKRLIDDQWFVDTTSPTAGYQKSFEQATGKTTTRQSEVVYAILQILRDAAEMAGSKKTDLIQYLSSGQPFTTTLGTVHFNAEGVLQSEASIKEIEKGQAVLKD